MKLWIDDIRNAPDDSWTVVRTVTSAINFIDKFGMEIEAISFDHDISYQIELNGVSRPYPSPETFKAVALFAAHYFTLLSRGRRPMIYVHSANPVGSKDIIEIFEAGFVVEYKPMGAANRLETEV